MRSFGQFPLAATAFILLKVLTEYGVDVQTLARLEATCTYLRKFAQFYPDGDLPLSEIAAFDICNKKEIFKRMTNKESENLRKICGGSWNSGELGIGTIEDRAHPCRIRSLQGIRIVQAAVASNRTILVSDAGHVYSFGKPAQGELEPADGVYDVLTPQLNEYLKDIFVMQAAFGNFFAAFLSREGRVYTLSWGKFSNVGHQTDLNDSEPQPLLGGLENVPVVQIAAGYCYLLALACQPSGMSVYSVGSGSGGKLGHGTLVDEPQPRLIEKFQTLKLQPKMIAAGALHCAFVGADGRVCTWGWGNYGCLGHGDEECQLSPNP